MLLGRLRIPPCSHCVSLFDSTFSEQTLPFKWYSYRKQPYEYVAYHADSHRPTVGLYNPYCKTRWSICHNSRQPCTPQREPTRCFYTWPRLYQPWLHGCKDDMPATPRADLVSRQMMSPGSVPGTGAHTMKQQQPSPSPRFLCGHDIVQQESA